MGGKLITVATCSLNQWATDWEGNRKRIVESIHVAKEAGATLRCGPELEISGYGCQDAFLEMDTYDHSWDQLQLILEDETCNDILLDIGMPVMHRGRRFNCRIICLNSKILMIRPKLWLADDGNYREGRWFTPFSRPQYVEEYYLPENIQKLQGKVKVPFGDACISTPDTCLGAETCEELFTPQSPHIDLSLNGVEIFTNSSGSHHTLRKLDVRLKLITEATRKCGGIYLYANQQGCDGDRLYYDGCAMIVVNGEIVAQGSQFSLQDVEVVTAVVDLEEVRGYRSLSSHALQSRSAPVYQRIETEFSLSSGRSDANPMLAPSGIRDAKYHSPPEEIALSTGAWLWDYIRRSGAAGFLVPLSGGIDSCATSICVYSMCRLVYDSMQKGDKQVISDVRRLCRYSDELPTSPQAICNQLFATVYMGMKKQSSYETRKRAQDLSTAIGSMHTDLDIDQAYEAQRNLIPQYLSYDPKFETQGGTPAESLMLQNIQARLRMVTAYQFAQMLPTTRKRPGGGGLLVLGSANVGESLRGYFTKYDCSSADINPIGSIDKSDLKMFIEYAMTEFNLPCLRGFLDAVPTAELMPMDHSGKVTQSDELDMGMSYDELTKFGSLRKVHRLGALGMFQRLVHEWGPGGERTPHLTPREVAEKVKRFYHFFAINRHKATVLTPSLHMQDYSPEDNRFDQRQFLYPGQYNGYAFKRIDEELEKIEKYTARGKLTRDSEVSIGDGSD